MRGDLVIGTGPAAAATVLALRARGERPLTLMDLGATLEAHNQALLSGVKTKHPRDWPAGVRAVLARQPGPETKGELPQKQVLGSDYPFRELGQLTGVTAERGGNRRIVSGAFGGFSNAWGAQVLPFTRETIDQWPIPYAEMLSHYEAVLKHLPYAASEDDYAEFFPILTTAKPLPPLSDGAATTLARYARHRPAVRRTGVVLGRARLAFDAPQCIECGCCLSGCPLDLIYSARQTLDKMIQSREVSYQPGLLVLAVGEDEAGCWVRARRIADGVVVTERADRVFVAAGGLGSTRIVMNSARRDVLRVEMAESAQFVLPFLSLLGQRDPRSYSTFTLNQFSAIVRYGRKGLDLAHLHFYPYNSTFDAELPTMVARHPRLKTAVLKRTLAALGYLPSWASPGLLAETRTNGDDDCLPNIRITSQPNPATVPSLAKTMARLLAAAPSLDLWPGLPVLRLSGPGKSYHFGASLPHISGRPRAGKMETDTLGRIAEWRRIHLVDGSVLPTIPATTFTLSVMANAHRIASSARDAR